MTEKKNALIPDRTPDNSPMNYLASYAGMRGGSKEYIKAYMHQFIGNGDEDYSEKHLSPQGIETIRQLAAMNYGVKHSDSGGDFVGIGDYPPNDPTKMNFAIGAIAPSNIRKVDIKGVPYWQVLDHYDFNGAEDEAAKKGGKMHLLKNFFDGAMRGDPNPEELPAAMGLKYNMNFLVPVNPAQSAPDDLVEAYRRQSSLSNNPAFPNRTLPGNAVNALRNAATPKHPLNEKAMP